MLIFPLAWILISQFTIVSLRRLDYHWSTWFSFLNYLCTIKVAFWIIINDLIWKLKFSVFEANCNFPWPYFLTIFINQPFNRSLGSIHSDRLSRLHFCNIIRSKFWGWANDSHIITLVIYLLFNWIIYRELYFEIFPLIIDFTEFVLFVRWRSRPFSWAFTTHRCLRRNSSN